MKNSHRPVGRWELTLNVERGTPRDGMPLFLRIARSISSEIARRRIKPGAQLPGSRELARLLSVHRNTVLAAYRELLAEGWLDSESGRGTFVSRTVPEPKPQAIARRSVSSTASAAPTPRTALGFPLPPFEAQALPKNLEARTLYLYGGLPDLRLIPSSALAQAYRRVLRHSVLTLGYGDPQGHPALRETLAPMLSVTRGLALEPSDIVITRGSQMAIALAARALLQPGDRVAIEAFGYRPAWEALRLAGAALCPVAVDEHGLSLDALERLCDESPIRALYLTPHHQYPTTVPLAMGRRLQLLELAAKKRFAILEDDYDHEFHYDGRPLLPLASADRSAVVLYIGTLSKVLAPGLRVGYLVAPRPVRDRVVALRYFLDRQGDHAMECALAELIEEGELARHLRRVQRVYRTRRDHCVARLQELFGADLAFKVPKGGMSLWVKSRGVAVDPWLARTTAQGVLFQTARQFAWDERARPFLRLGYAALNEAEMNTALEVLRRSFHKS